MKTVPINNERYLQRELSSRAILNTDKGSLQRYHEQSAVIKYNKQQLSEIDTMKSEINEIKGLLQEILLKIQGQ